MKQLVIGDMMQELQSTRRVIESLPEEQFAWKPHAKSMSLGDLATHTVNILNWMIEIIRHAEFDLASVPARRDAHATKAGLLAEYDSALNVFEPLLHAIDEVSLQAAWTLRSGDAVLRTEPRASALRTFGISHMIHHRAQLTVYLRLLDVRVPGVYGPTADDMPSNG